VVYLNIKSTSPLLQVYNYKKSQIITIFTVSIKFTVKTEIPLCYSEGNIATFAFEGGVVIVEIHTVKADSYLKLLSYLFLYRM
jgi:hypothetical protein